jgi:Peptidase family M13
LDLLEDEIGGWPILNLSWDASKFDLFEVLTKIRVYGDEPFFSISVYQDMEKPSDNLIFITEPETFATKDVLLSDAGKMYTDSYEKYLFNVTSLLLKESGDQQDVAKVSTELMDIMELGRYISLVSTTL